MSNSPPGIQCSPRVDNSFGPWAGPCRGGFDFTLFFEEAILTIPLLVGFLLVLPVRLWLITRQNEKVTSSYMRLFKALSCACWITFELALLVLWTSNPTKPQALRTRATTATITLSFVVAVGFSVLSWLEHMRSIRPARILDVFLVLSILLNIPRARTLWLIKPGSSIPVLFTCSLVIKCVLVILESTDKRKILLPAYILCSKEEISGSLSRGVFFWLTSLFLNGYRNLLSLDDLYPLDAKLETSRLRIKLKEAWANVVDKNKSGAFMYTWLGTHRHHLLTPVFARLCLIALTFSQPFLVEKAIALASTPNEQEYNNIGYGLIGAYILVYTGIAITNGRYYHGMNRAAIMMRGSVVPAVMEKTLHLASSDASSATALSLINTDIETITPAIVLLHEVWAGIIEITVATYLLYRQIGAACAVPIAFSLFVLIVSAFLAIPIGVSQAAWIAAAQNRIAATSAVLNKIQWIRLSGITQSAFENINRLRTEELQVSRKYRIYTMCILTLVSRKYRIYTMCILTLASCTPIFSPLLTFVTFALLALRNNDAVTISKIFTSLSLFALLSAPLTMIIVALPTIAAGITSFGRIQGYLCLPDHVDRRFRLLSSNKSQGSVRLDSSDDHGLLSSKLLEPSTDAMIELGSIPSATGSRNLRPIIHVSGKLSWPETTTPVLDISKLSVPRHSFTVMTGPVGCGKSTLLKCMLGEMPTFDGEITTTYSIAAYCDQTSYVPNSTIRNLVIATSAYDEKWFNIVANACALLPDFQQWPQGDQSQVGTQGVSLSGGQKQRLAIARAVYSRQELIVFDDTFSGLDSRTKNMVFNNLLGNKGLLRTGGITVLMATSDKSRANFADHLIVMSKEGSIAAQGSTVDVLQQPSVQSLFNTPSMENWQCPSSHSSTEESATTAPLQAVIPSTTSDSITQTDKRRQIGDSAVYGFYLRSAGWKPTIIFLVAMLIFTFCDAFPNIWLKWWAEANIEEPNQNLEKWLTVYAALAVAGMTSLLIGTWQIFIVFITNSGIHFHELLINTVSRATAAFFSAVDVGITVNRFSQDLMLIDMELPANALGVASTFAYCVAQAVMMSVASKYFAVTIPFICAMFYIIQHFYLRTSRQMRLLDIEHKAPLYSQLLETVNGITTIRAFNWQDSINEKWFQLLDDSQRPSYLQMCLQQWLVFAVNMIVAFMAVILITLTTTLREEIGPGYMGIALINIIAFGETTKALIHTWVGLETSIGAVARVKDFGEDTPVEKTDSERSDTPATWPSAGLIEFKNLNASYNTVNTVLKDINLAIASHEKIGICGRTGSGKSSILQALFGMLPITNGSISVDGLDITLISASTVRSRLVAVPQEVYIFVGSIRKNLDPSSDYRDGDIIAALQRVKLWDSVIVSRGGLDAEIDDQFFSHGQAQLFSLARAILRKAKVLILDEVTSALDDEMEDVVMDIVTKEFESATVIAVAHRLRFIQGFDRVVVMESGNVAEVGSPQDLMLQESSKFKELVDLQGRGGDKAQKPQ